MSLSSNPRFLPPLVSVVITNYNYGRFLRDAVDSVLAQTYSHIECIIVDDASTDESSVVLAKIGADYPAAKIIRRPVNGGQLAATLDGFAASTGDYVVFLDADDLLFDECIATHVFVNLSLRLPPGFTCSDMAQLAGDRLVLGSTSAMYWYIRSTTPAMKPAVRPIPEAIAGRWTSTALDPSVLDRLYNVDTTCRTWPWAATSAFFFRRDALDLWTDTPRLAQLRRSTDGFFGRAINAVTGSVIIDQPLAAWRIHGDNNFCKQPQLGNLRNYDLVKELCSLHRRILLEEVMRDPARFPLFDPDALRTMLETFDTPDIAPDAPQWAKPSRLSYLLVREYASLSKLLGEQTMVQWMRQKGVPAEVVRQIVGTHAPAAKPLGKFARVMARLRLK